jgi:hypothetical protein
MRKIHTNTWDLNLETTPGDLVFSTPSILAGLVPNGQHVPTDSETDPACTGLMNN